MEQKKSRKADLERVRGMFFLIGLVLALGLVLFAFTWQKEPEELAVSFLQNGVPLEEEHIAITRSPEVQVLPSASKASEVLKLINNDIKINQNIQIDSESNESKVDSSNEFDNARLKEESIDESAKYIMLEEMPLFMGGRADETFREWIFTNTRYPKEAQSNGISGKVLVRFCIDTNGNVVDVAVSKSVDPLLDKEAIRVISSSPKWTPAKQRGKAIKVQFTFPVSFILQ